MLFSHVITSVQTTQLPRSTDTPPHTKHWLEIHAAMGARNFCIVETLTMGCEIATWYMDNTRIL